MNNQNLVSVTLAEEVISEINDAIANIRTNLPFLIVLTAEERKEQLKLGDASLPFVLKARDAVNANPSNVPGYMDVPEFLKDVKAYEELSKILQPIKELATAIDDTLMVAGTEAYGAALAYYHYIKYGAKTGAPGAKTIYEELRERFKANGRKSIPPTE